MTSKPKLEVLDALRGFCALCVVVLHFSENYIPGWGLRLLPHGCLPVEYFFILTGFTLVYAYEERLANGLSFGSFFRRRVIRLQPLVVIGSIIGAACYLLASEQYAKQVPGGSLSLAQLFGLTLWCSTMLPAPQSLGWTLLHPLQGPLWTLFYIYVANVLYALVLRRFKTGLLMVLAALAVAFTWQAGLRAGGFHCGACWSWWWGEGWKGWLAVWQGTNVGALARMSFPLLAGMIIARKGWKIRSGRWSLWICIAILSFVFLAPEMRPVSPISGPLDSQAILSALGLKASKALNGGFESAAVVVGMPLVLLIGIGGEIRSVRLAAVCRFLGKFSFPLYCTHYSLTMVERVWRDAHPSAPWQMHLAVCCACLLFALINAYVAMKVADWVAQKFGK